MIKRRIIWFTFGFASASAAIAPFIFLDVLADREKHFSHVNEKFIALDNRVANLEKVFQNNPDSNVPRPEAISNE